MQFQRQDALKQNFTKIEFENSITRLSFLCRLPDIKITWINPCYLVSRKTSEKIDESILRSLSCGRTGGRTDGQSQIHSTFS